MINKINIECKAIYAVGDIHGYFNKLVEMIKKYRITDTAIVVCGDCGLGFSSVNGEKHNIKKLDSLCKKNNNTIVMIRGNHDNPMFFETGIINTKNIIAVPDYTILNDDILLVGGAISIDRRYRIMREEVNFRTYLYYHPGSTIEDMREKNGGGYWPDEVPVYNEELLNEIKNNGIQIKHICTHTCPNFCEPLSKDGIKGWLKDDDKLLEDVDNERWVMTQLWNKMKDDKHPLETWCYGHYHYHNTEIHDNVKFTMLDAIVGDYSNVDWIEIKNN